jgi:MHS family proline/betaine transporter-like MFS transporter
VPAFLTTVGSLGEGDALWLSTAAAMSVIAITPVTGLLSDRVGRRPVLIAVAISSAVLPMVMFAWMADGSMVRALAGAVVLALVGGAVSAVGAVSTAEQFPGEGRLTGLALGATSATAIFGGLTPLVAQQLIERTGWPLVPGAMIAAVALLVLPVLLTMPETRGRADQPDPLLLTRSGSPERP